MSSQAADLTSLGTPQPPIPPPPFNVPPAETLTPSQISQNPSLALEKYKKKDAVKGRNQDFDLMYYMFCLIFYLAFFLYT